MIQRKSKISPERTEISFMLSFGSPDVRRWMKNYVKLLTRNYDPDLVEQISNEPFTIEGDLRHWLESEPRIFGSFPSPELRQDLSKWAWVQTIKLGLLEPSAGDSTHYYLTDPAFKKVGRPRNRV